MAKIPFFPKGVFFVGFHQGIRQSLQSSNLPYYNIFRKLTTPGFINWVSGQSLMAKKMEIKKLSKFNGKKLRKILLNMIKFQKKV